METWMVVAVLGMGTTTLVVMLPIVALVTARRARRAAEEMRGQRDHTVEELRSQLAAMRKTMVLIQQKMMDLTAAVAARPAEAEAAGSATVPATATTPAIEVVVAEAPVVESVVPVVVVAAPPIAAAPVTAQEQQQPQQQQQPTRPPPERLQERPGALPPNALPMVAVPASAAGSSLEERIALVWFTRIGAVVMLLGAVYFFKFAVDNQWIGPLGRVLIGVLAGVLLLATAEFLRPRSRAIYIHILAGVGLAVLYISIYASHAYYQLLPLSGAFAGTTVVTLLGGALAVRHRAESTLIVSLIAGFLSPVLLSTGQDRALALFAYLMVLTALGFLASVRMSFRWATWLQVLGTVLLFAGWYGRFFTVAAPALDLPPEALRLLYYPLGRRVVPLAAVTLFLVEWLLVYRACHTAAHREARAVLWPTALLVTAVSVAHVGFSVLLYDEPVLLGILMTGLAFSATTLLAREDRRELGAIPLGCSFFALLATAPRAHQSPVAMLTLMALWAGIYGVTFLRGDEGRIAKPKPLAVVLVCLVGVAFAILAGATLGQHHPRSFAFLLVGLSLLYAVLAIAIDNSVVAGGASVVTFFGLLTVIGLVRHDNATQGTDGGLILVAAAWAAVYLGTTAYDLLIRRAPPTVARLLTLSGAGLGFALLAELQVGDKQLVLRAALLAAVGVVDLALGAALLRVAPRPRATVMLGQALGLFAGAVAFLFSGAPLTLLWATLATVMLFLAADADDPWWLAGAGALFLLALLHLASIDVHVEEVRRAEFWGSEGRSGLLRLPVLLNPRAYSLAGTAILLLLAGRFAENKRPPSRLFHISGMALASLAHVLLLLVAISEARNLALSTPTPPAGLDPTELAVFQARFDAAWGGARHQMAMITTLVLGLYATVLVGIGFGARSFLYRWLGLGLLAITILKLVGYDAWRLEGVYQMLVLIGSGALLLGVGFLYARFGKRLAAILREGAPVNDKGVDKVDPRRGGDGGTAAALLLLVGGATLLGGLGSARAQPAAFVSYDWAEQRTVDGVAAPGLYRVEIDAALYQRSRTENALADLRVVGPDGTEVPCFVRPIAATATEVAHAAALVDPVVLADGSARAVLDLGKPGLKHSEVRLTIDGESYIRPVRIEVSSDEQNWALLALAAEGTPPPVVYSIITPDGRATRSHVSYPLSDARYLRITLLPGATPPTSASPTIPRITGAVVAYAVPETRPPQRKLAVRGEVKPKLPVARASQLVIDLGASGLPVADVTILTTTPGFERRATLSASNHTGYWVSVGSGLLFRAAAAESLTLGAGGVRKRFLQIQIEDGDNPPLAITGTEVGYRPEELVFRATVAGAHTLLVGNAAASAPSYDLPAVVARSGEVPQAGPSLGAVVANPRYGKAPAAPRPFTEQHPWLLGGVLAAVVLALAAWTLRLMRRKDTSDGDHP